MPDLHTGRYAAFIWPAYGFTLAVIVWMVLDTLARARRWRRRAERKPPKDGEDR
jgi:heme exporter protein D